MFGLHLESFYVSSRTFWAGVGMSRGGVSTIRDRLGDRTFFSTLSRKTSVWSAQCHPVSLNSGNERICFHHLGSRHNDNLLSEPHVAEVELVIGAD